MSKKKKKNNKLENNIVKKNVKNKNNVTKENDSDIFKLVKIILVIVFIVLGVWALTYFMDKAGVFDEGYTRGVRNEAIISYDVSLVGTIFNKKESEYYVVFDEYGNRADQYLYSVTARYNNLEDVLKLYTVDMSSGFNKNYLGENSNPSAQKSEDILINGPTLIKIKNGKNVKYIEGVKNIEKELLK